jgi:hypothetical protein
MSYNMRSDILLVVTVKITVFWDVMPCSLVDVYGPFGGALVNCQTVWHDIPEDSDTL